MFDWIKKVKKHKKEDEVFVITPDEVIEEAAPDEVIEEAAPDEVIEEAAPDEVIEESFKIKPDVFTVDEIKKSDEKKAKKSVTGKEKAKPKKSLNLKPDPDLGRLNLRKHAITKRREYLAERKKYEREYLVRLKKQQKAKPKKSLNLKPDPDLGRLNLRKHVIVKRREYLAERKKYEREYLVRLKKQQKAKPKKKSRLPRKRKQVY